MQGMLKGFLFLLLFCFVFFFGFFWFFFLVFFGFFFFFFFFFFLVFVFSRAHRNSAFLTSAANLEKSISTILTITTIEQELDNNNH